MIKKIYMIKQIFKFKEEFDLKEEFLKIVSLKYWEIIDITFMILYIIYLVSEFGY